MDNALKNAQRQFTLLTVAVAVLCAVVSVAVTFLYSQAQIDNRINAAKISELSINNKELSEYLLSQKENHAHFDNIAAIIQREDQRKLYQSLPIIFGSVFLVSTAIGWLLARKLLKPVNDAYYIQRRFMQDAAHELRNPLAAMKSLIQRSLNRKIADKQLAEMIHSLDRQTNNLSDITTDLLLLERKELPGKEKIELVGLLNDVIEQLHLDAKQKKVRVVVNTPDQLLATMNPQHFVSISKNIIQNAIKFSDKPKKPVEVTLKKRQSGWMLHVRDQGIGINKDDQKLLTQRFYRGSNTVGIDGTGLGLSIVAKYIGLYKGKFNITSIPGKGTSITVVM